jgi:exodeoxyribonuclease VIII
MPVEVLKMSDREYHAIKDRCSASAIKGGFRKSPAHYKAEQDKQSDALSFGNVAHKAILEPESFREKYVVAPEVNKRTKAGKEKWEEFLRLAGDREVISKTDHETVLQMRQTFKAHKIANSFLDKADSIEIVVFFDLFGVPFKAKLDIVSTFYKAVVDYKTSRDASEDSFQRDYIKYGYHIQGFIYHEAAKAAGFDVNKFILIPQEKTKPFGLNVFPLNPNALELGRLQTEKLAPAWWDCYQKDSWPCYEEKAKELDLPYWANKLLDSLQPEINPNQAIQF